MKTSLRSIVFVALCTVGVLSLSTYFSCRKDKCQGVECSNGGICDGGVCFCPPGYEGLTCDTIPRNKFVGNWAADQSNDKTTTTHYVVSIVAGGQVYSVAIYNLNNTFTKAVTAYISSDDSLIIPQQQLQGKYVIGSVHYVNSTDLEANYKITDSATNDILTVSATWY